MIGRIRLPLNHKTFNLYFFNILRSYWLSCLDQPILVAYFSFGAILSSAEVSGRTIFDGQSPNLTTVLTTRVSAVNHAVKNGSKRSILYLFFRSISMITHHLYVYLNIIMCNDVKIIFLTLKPVKSLFKHLNSWKLFWKVPWARSFEVQSVLMAWSLWLSRELLTDNFNKASATRFSSSNALFWSSEVILLSLWKVTLIYFTKTETETSWWDFLEIESFESGALKVCSASHWLKMSQ